SAGDRAIFNPKGTAGVGSGVSPLCKSSLPAGVSCGSSASRPFLVGYLANNGNAQYITAGSGAFANSGRNTLQLPPIDNVDLNITKRFKFTERYTFEFGATMLNLFNHPQYIAGLINDVASFGNTTDAARNGFLNPKSASFLNPKVNFPSNARTMSLIAKFK